MRDSSSSESLAAQEEAPAAAWLPELIRFHRRTLQTRALWLTRNPSDAGDLVQDTVARALRRPGRPVGGGAGLRWLFTIMHNAHLDVCRARAVRRWIPLDPQLEQRLAREEAPLALWRRIDDERLHACIARLPGPFRTIIELQLKGWSYAEMSRQLRLPAGTVGTRLLRAKRHLRRMLTPLLEGAIERGEEDVEDDGGDDAGDETGEKAANEAGNKSPPARLPGVGGSSRKGPRPVSAGSSMVPSDHLGVGRLASPPTRAVNNPGKAVPCHCP